MFVCVTDCADVLTCVDEELSTTHLSIFGVDPSLASVNKKKKKKQQKQKKKVQENEETSVEKPNKTVECDVFLSARNSIHSSSA